MGEWEEASTIRNISQDLAIKAEKKKLKKSFEDIVPKAYHHFKAGLHKEAFDDYCLGDRGITQ